MAELTDTDIRETVRERYAAAANRIARGATSGCGNDSPAAAAPPSSAASTFIGPLSVTATRKP